jgi:hypothetical protein
MKTGSPGDESLDGSGPSKPPPNEQPAILGGQFRKKFLWPIRL